MRFLSKMSPYLYFQKVTARNFTFRSLELESPDKFHLICELTMPTISQKLFYTSVIHVIVLLINCPCLEIHLHRINCIRYHVNIKPDHDITLFHNKYRFLRAISFNNEVYEWPVLWKIPHRAAKFEVGEGNRIVYENLYWFVNF